MVWPRLCSHLLPTHFAPATEVSLLSWEHATHAPTSEALFSLIQWVWNTPCPNVCVTQFLSHFRALLSLLGRQPPELVQQLQTSFVLFYFPSYIHIIIFKFIIKLTHLSCILFLSFLLNISSMRDMKDICLILYFTQHLA